MKKLRLSALLLIFIFSYTNSSERQERMQFLSPQSLWLETKGKKLFCIYSPQINKYPILNYYISRFGYANTCNTPLKVESTNLDFLASIKLDDFLKKFPDKQSSEMSNGPKLEYALMIGKELCGELGKKIVRLLQRLTHQSELSMVINSMMFQKLYYDDKCFRKTFFNNKKNYSCNDDCIGIKFYDHNDHKIFAIDYDEDFISANKSSVILLYDVDGFRDHIRIYDFATKQLRIIPGNFSDFQISSNGHYVALRSDSMINTIQIYDVRDIDNLKRVAQIDHIDLHDFCFSPDSSKLISWTSAKNSELILWDLEDIESIKEVEKILLPGIKCSQVQFNQDNEHVCVISCGSYDEEGGVIKSFDQGSGVIVNINTSAVFKLPSWEKAQIFCDNSDLIVCRVWGCFDKMTKTKDFKTKIFTKFGKKLHLPECVKDFLLYLTADYLFMSRCGQGYLFDHQMNLVTYVGNDNVSFQLDAENNIVAQNLLIGDFGYWPIPSKEKIKAVQAISAKLTLDQFVSLESICLQDRQQKEFCILQEESSIAKVFKTFDEDEQSFLKEQLFIQ